MENPRNTGDEQHIEHDGWRQTPEKEAAQKRNRRKDNLGCLGYVLVFLSVVGATVASSHILFNRSGGEAPVLLGDLTTQYPFLSDNLVPITLLCLAVGLLLAFFMHRKRMRELIVRYEEIERNPQSAEYDRMQLNRWKKYRKSSKTSRIVGFILLFISLLSIPIALIFPLSGLGAEDMDSLVVPFFGAGLVGVFFLIRPFFKAIPLYLSTGTPVSPEQTIYGLLQQYFTDVVFRRGDGIPRAVVDGTHLLFQGNSYSANDYIQGKYKGLSFVQSDIKYENHTYTHTDDRRSVTVFSGRWLTVESPKTIDSCIYLFNKPFTVANKKYIESEQLQEVEIEDVGFNADFSIYAQNPHDVFYLLTPALIDRLKTFAGVQTGQPLVEGIGMYGIRNQLHFAISGVDDAFCFLYVGSITEAEVKSRIAKDISLVTDIIDTLVSDGTNQ